MEKSVSGSWVVERLVSGGQTGVDRAALDWAIQHNLPHGGWCPKGRLAEDGVIAARYQLKETPLSTYAQRTEWNVRDSDGTVIFSSKKKLSEGSLTTEEMAGKLGKPCLHLWPGASPDCAGRLRLWINENRIQVLNVAGPRLRDDPDAPAFVVAILDKVLSI